MFIGQTVPHMPQFFASPCTSVHMLLQTFSLVLQHMPSVHCSVIDMHAVPHMPQLSLSVFVSTHAPLHSTLPIGQMIEHAPAAQPHVPPPMMVPASGPPHWVPHLPQLALSTLTSTQALPHLVVPDGH
jgi:hypothetical protein